MPEDGLPPHGDDEGVGLNGPADSEDSEQSRPEDETEDERADRWAHVDPDHPRPWDGCIRRGLCCRTSPGWFAPGEAERVAEHLKIDMGDLVNRFLVIDRVQTTIGSIEGFAPVKIGKDGLPVEPTGGKTSSAYHLWQGACIFFDGESCGIYPVRPLECRLYCCTNLPEDNPRKLDLALLWLGAWKSREDGTLPLCSAIEDVVELKRRAQAVRDLMAQPGEAAADDEQEPPA